MANSIEVARAYVTIVPSLQGAQKEISTQLDAETKDVGEKSGEKVGSGMSSGIGSAIAKGAKVIVGAVTAVASAAYAGVVAITKQAISAYADYEQLVGGVDKLFGEETAKTISANAQKAFQTAGLSANDYMETITGFSASLIQSLNGDTEKAAQMADQAIVDMSDNANTFGTSIESIQNAYQGFAKGNYSMLDNLKLGYGGTQQEMFRLLQDAAAIDEAFAQNAQFSMDEKGHLVANFADITEAIHIVQTQMNITGTTSKEALGTISGSVSATKASWDNFLTSLASDDPDMMADSLDGLTTSLFGVEGETNGLLNNVIPRVEKVLNSLSNVIAKELPGLVDKVMPMVTSTLTTLGNLVATQLPVIIMALLPVITQAINTLLITIGPLLPALVNTLVQSIQMLIPTIINLLVNSGPTISSILLGVVQIITTLVTALSEGDNTQRLVNGAVQIITTLVEGIAMNLPILIPAVVEIITQIITTLTSPENIEALLQAALLLLGALVEALADCIPVLIEGVVGLLTNIGDLFVDAVYWVSDVLIPTLVNFWTTKVVPWLESVKEFFANIWTAIKTKISEIWNSIVSFFVSIFTNIKNNVTNNFNAVKDFITNVFNNIKNTITNIWNNIKSTITNTINNIKTSISNVFNNVKTNITNIFNAVKTTVTNIWTGIKNAITTPINAAKDAVQNAINKVKSILSGNLSFPSIKLPHFSISGSFSLAPPKVPKLSIDWYAKGYDQAQILNGAQIFGAMGSQMLAGGERGAEVVVGEQHLMDMIAQAKGGNITINVYASEGMNETTLAERVAEKLQQITESKEIVYA